MVDWMIEVTSTFKLDERTFFLSVAIMDSYLAEERECQTKDDIHEIGVVAMFMASKYEDFMPLSLPVVMKKISHGTFTKEQLQRREL